MSGSIFKICFFLICHNGEELINQQFKHHLWYLFFLLMLLCFTHEDRGRCLCVKHCDAIEKGLIHTHTHTHTHTHKHTQTHVGFYGLRGLSVMVFILYKLYVLLPYTYPTPKLSSHRRRCISTFPPKNAHCMIYKHFKLWGHWKRPHKSPSPCVLINHINMHTHTPPKLFILLKWKHRNINIVNQSKQICFYLMLHSPWSYEQDR